ncbi:MAG: VanZ family protein, partial [Acidimicrobiia bacterium]
MTLGWLGCFAYLTLSPQIPDLPGLSAEDRVLGTGHLVASFILAGLVHLWLVLARPGRGPARTAVTAFAATAAFGLLVELVQFPVPEREPQLADAVLDLVGAAAAVALLARVPVRVLRRPATTVAVGVAGAVLIAGTAAAGVWGTTT